MRNEKFHSQGGMIWKSSERVTYNEVSASIQSSGLFLVFFLFLVFHFGELVGIPSFFLA